jgi:hypothetical protein
MTAEFEEIVLRAVINNSEELHLEAQNYANEHNLTETQIDRACENVTNFIGQYGIQYFLPQETNAIVKIQAFFRKLLVRKKLLQNMQFWERLAKSDCIEHIHKAEQIHTVLYPPKKRRKTV